MRSMLLVAACLIGGRLSGQTELHHDHSVTTASTSGVDQLVAQARAATEIFSDRSVAIANGYHRAGRDLPMMGEHWLNTRRLIDGSIDVTRPQILMYMDVDGKPMLTGIVFAIPLSAGESPPDVFGDVMWHEHNGTVDDEALLPQHHAVPMKARGTRVAFLHVWTRVPFSETMFGAENWALPFVRVGIPLPAKFSESAARCLSVLNGGRNFYMDLIGSRSDSAAFGVCEEKTAELVAKAKSDHRPLTETELGALDTAWQDVLKFVENESGLEMAERINGGKSPANDQVFIVSRPVLLVSARRR